VLVSYWPTIHLTLVALASVLLARMKKICVLLGMTQSAAVQRRSVKRRAAAASESIRRTFALSFLYRKW